MKAQRVAWLEEFLSVAPAHLVFLDETGANTAMDRRYGRSASGKRVDGPAPHGHWKMTTPIAAIRLDGVVESGCLAFDGATDRATFEDYVERCLVPNLRAGDVVILDDLAAHKSAEVARPIGSVGASVRYLPAYSPDFNPIEGMFSKLKAFLRSAKARTWDALIAAMGQGLRPVRPGDILGWFTRCGYRG